jgi:hypothetical protein
MNASQTIIQCSALRSCRAQTSSPMTSLTTLYHYHFSQLLLPATYTHHQLSHLASPRQHLSHGHPVYIHCLTTVIPHLLGPALLTSKIPCNKFFTSWEQPFSVTIHRCLRSVGFPHPRSTLLSAHIETRRRHHFTAGTYCL